MAIHLILTDNDGIHHRTQDFEKVRMVFGGLSEAPMLIDDSRDGDGKTLLILGDGGNAAFPYWFPTEVLRTDTGALLPFPVIAFEVRSS